MPPQEPEKLSPITHRQLLEIMKALGYNVASRGMCYGFTHVAIMAGLLGQLEVYTRRLRLIKRIYHENLDLITDKNISAEEKKQRLEELLETVYAAKNEERNEHSTKTDVLAFFDAVAVYQSPSRNMHLFPRGRNLPIQSFKDSFLLVSPTVFDGKRKAVIEDPESVKGGEEDNFALGPIMVKPLGCGVYQREHLERYFRELEKKIPRLNLKGPVCLRMENENHTFVVSYSSLEKRWVVINAGEPEYYSGDKLSILSEAVLKIFHKQVNGSVAISSILYTHFDDDKHFKVLFSGYEKRPSIHAKPIQDLTPAEQLKLLYVAVNADNSFLIKMILLQGKVNINQASEDGFTLLMTACLQGYINVVKVLLNAGATVDQDDKYGFTSLMRACQRGHFEVVEVLIGAKADINKTNIYGFTPTMIACQYGHVGTAAALINVGAGAEIAAQNGETALLLASEYGHLETVKFLIEKKVSLDKADRYGFTPLLIACKNNHLGVVEALLNARATVDQGDKDGFTPLMMACQEGHFGIVKVLMKAGAKVDKVKSDGFSALFIACQKGYQAVVKFLLAKNANHTLSGKASIQVLRSLAKKQGREKQFQDLLQQHNISINDKTIPDFSPLAIAVFMGHEAIVKMLLEKTQSAELNKGPIRLIELARAMGHASIARLLMAKTKPEPNKVSHQALVSPGNGSAFYHDVRRLLDALYAELKEGHPKSNISENGKVGGCLNDLLTLNRLLQRAQGQENKKLPSYRSAESERIKKAFETVCNMTITNTTQMVDILRVFRALPYAKQGALDRTVRSRGVRLAPS